MSVALLDGNVLISLLDPAHPSHNEAHDWFGRHGTEGWATSPVTLNGCVRILSSPAYQSMEATTAQVISHLRQFCATREHRFWEDSFEIIDPKVFVPELIGGHAKVTDAYLLALPVRNNGRLATFDRGIPIKAVVGARPRNLELLGIPR